MKKQKQTKETLLQYIYEFGIESTCKHWGITEDKLDKILNPETNLAPKIRNLNTNSVAIKSEVSEIIANNYNTLYTKYVIERSKLSMCQNSEDIFHTTLLKVMEDLSEIDEKQVLEYIDYRLKMVNFQIKQDQKDLYKLQIYLEDANAEQNPETEN